MLAALDHTHFHCFPFAGGKCFGTYDFCQRLAVDCGGRGEYCHLLAMAAVGAAVDDAFGRNVEPFYELMLQTCAVERGESRHLRGFQTRIQQCDQTGDVGRIEDHDHMLYIGAIGVHIFAELLGNLSIAFKKVFAGHTGFAGCAAAVHYILGIGESFLDIGSEGEIYTFESAGIEFFGHAFKCGGIWIVKTDIGCKMHHHGCLCHVGAYHAGSADDDEFVVCKKFHRWIVFS